MNAASQAISRETAPIAVAVRRAGAGLVVVVALALHDHVPALATPVAKKPPPALDLALLGEPLHPLSESLQFDGAGAEVGENSAGRGHNGTWRMFWSFFYRSTPQLAEKIK